MASKAWKEKETLDKAEATTGKREVKKRKRTLMKEEKRRKEAEELKKKEEEERRATDGRPQWPRREARFCPETQTKLLFTLFFYYFC